KHCEQTGVIGRTVVPEIIVPDQKLMMHIRRGDRDRAYAYWKETGGKTMLDVAKEKIVAGLIDPFQAELVVGLLDAGLELDPALLEQA
ncbi:MAG: secretion system protein E, partial [Polaromonas sp.]|nr:secretion system protein E [Polaromonas sp.]